MATDLQLGGDLAYHHGARFSPVKHREASRIRTHEERFVVRLRTVFAGIAGSATIHCAPLRTPHATQIPSEHIHGRCGVDCNRGPPFLGCGRERYFLRERLATA